MRLAPRLIVIALASLAVGCGGSSADVQEVPGPPVQLDVPGDGAPLASGQVTAATEAEATPTPEETSEESAETTTQAPPTDTSGGGGAAPQQQTPAQQAAPQSSEGGGAQAPAEDNAATDEPPPPGSDAEQFEDYCANNPGAC